MQKQYKPDYKINIADFSKQVLEATKKRKP